MKEVLIGWGKIIVVSLIAGLFLFLLLVSVAIIDPATNRIEYKLTDNISILNAYDEHIVCQYGGRTYRFNYTQIIRIEQTEQKARIVTIQKYKTWFLFEEVETEYELYLPTQELFMLIQARIEK